MEKIKISKEKLMKIKDIIIFVLLMSWMIMPILQTIKPINTIVVRENLYFILMKIIAWVGIGSAIFTIYEKFENSSNKKQVFKELLPIFLFVIYMIWTLFSCLKSPIKRQAFNGGAYRKEGFFMYINYAGFFFCAMLLENKKLRKILLNTFLITTIFLISISRIAKGGKKFQNIFVNNQIADSVFAQFNHYGYYLTMALICSLGMFITEKNKILKVTYLSIYTIIGYALIYNDTFGCYLATIAMLLLYTIYSLIKKKDRKLILIAVGIFTILSCITVKGKVNLAYKNLKELGRDLKIISYKTMNVEKEVINGEEVDIKESFEKTGTSRMKLWTKGIDFILERPLIGYGPDNLKTKYLMNGIDQDRPHNLIIYLGCVSGIPGMIIYVTAVGLIVFKAVIRLIKEKREGLIYLIIVITYLISSMFGNSMYYTSPYFFIFLGSLMQYNLKNMNDL